MERVKKVLFVVLLSLLSPILLFATTSQVSNTLAIDTLIKESSKIKGWYNHFNRAGALVKKKKYGLSLLHLERAKLQYDGFAPLDNNIRLIKQKTGADRFSLKVNGLVKTIFFYYFYFSRYTLINSIAIIIILLLLFLIIGFYRGIVILLWFKGVVIFFLALIVLFISALYLKTSKEFAIGRAIIVKEVKLFGSKNRQQSLTSLPEATEITVEKRDGNVSLVTLPGGLSGWVDKSSYCKIVNGQD